MKITQLLIILCSMSTIAAQNKVGINTNNPTHTLDLRGINAKNTGGELQLATETGEHFLRFFGGRPLDNKPFLLFSNLDTFRIANSAVDYANFKDLITIVPGGNVGIEETQPTQKLDVNGKLKIGNDLAPAQGGTLRFNANSNFEGYDGTGWTRLDNKLIYQDKKLSTLLGDTKRNFEQAWGDTITIQEDGEYLFFVSAYFSSAINEQYASGSSNIKYDNRGRLRIFINGALHKLLECGNGILDRDSGQLHVSFAPGTRSFMEVISFNAGDKISLTRNMQAVPAFTPQLTIPDIWTAAMDAFYIMKLE